MKVYHEKYLLLFGPAVCFLLLIVFAVYSKHITQRAPSALEIKVAQIRLGATLQDAEDIMGTPPDSAEECKGYIASPVIMLAATNSQAKDKNPPGQYTLQTWKEDETGATVVFDTAGEVVCRWAWSENLRTPNPYSPVQFLKRIGLL